MYLPKCVDESVECGRRSSSYLHKVVINHSKDEESYNDAITRHTCLMHLLSLVLNGGF